MSDEHNPDIWYQETHQRVGMPHPARWWVLASYLLVALVALLLRVADLGVFVAGDEVDFWIPRSERFLQALQSGDFDAIPVLGHPGVTTMWLGSAGIALRRALFEHGIIQTETFPVLLALHRLPVALAHTAGVLAGYAMLRRLFILPVAFLAAMLWATDPFVIAFSRVLHVDALAMTGVTLSLLAACVYWNHTPRPAWLVVSAVCAGLAILSKSPALAIVPVVGVLALVAARPRSQALLPLLAWGGVCVVTVLACWPAVWTSPLRVYSLLRVGVESEATSPHMLGNFFLGRRVDAPGVLFYPVTLALRATPWSLGGLLLLLPWVVGRVWGARQAGQAGQVGQGGVTLRDIATLAGFVILFTVAMSVFPKKFNRYLVPVFPAVDILAAVGLVWGAVWVGRVLRGERRIMRMQRVVAVATGGVALIALVNAVWWHPYGIASFNQVLGGAGAGARTFVVGWGEGYNEAAAWLNQQADITDVVTVSRWGSSINPYLRRGAQANSAEDGNLPESAGYVVVYVRHVQGGLPAPPYDHFYARTTPLHTVTIHGVEYAWIYDVPPRVAHAHTADFGHTVRLSGYEVDTAALRSSGVLRVTTQWQARGPVPADYKLFIHVFDASGEQVGSVDVPPAGPGAPTGNWQPGRYYTWEHPVPVQGAGTMSSFWVGLGLYHPDTFERLPLHAQARPGAPDDGPHVLFLPLLSVPHEP